MLNIEKIKVNAIIKQTKKISILLIIVMLFSSVFNIGIIANGDIKPDLDIISLEFDNTVNEGDEVVVKILIKNIGTQNISAGTHINAELRIDDVQVNTNFTDDGLDIGKTCYVNISWTAERGNEEERDLKVEIDVEGMSELSYINNVASSSIFVSEGKVDLKFTGEITIDGTPRMNEPIKIYVDAKNSGRNTTVNINVTLKIDGNYYADYVINGLMRNEVYTVSFVWIPAEFGVATINISIDPNDEIDEQDDSNNFIEEPDVTVRHPRLEWWNSSWHYRKLYKLTGTGNISESFNSTELLAELNIEGNTFENDTVTVVKYFLNGTWNCIVGNYSFNESAKELLWQVTDDTYYCVYFDVENNSGTRIETPEIADMDESGSVSIVDSTGYVEGWWVRPVNEINTYYIPGVPITFEMESTAEIHNMTALLYFEGIFNHTFDFTTTDNLTWIKQTFQQLEIGNWSIEVSGYDAAGYLSETITDDFFIGYPDLIVDSISIISDLPEGVLNYEDNDYTIKANILVYNASVDDINVTMTINENYFNSTIENITKNQNNMISFIWHPTKKGFYTITIEAMLIDDINQSNNQLSQNITIEGIPDLKLLNIFVPNATVDEDSSAEIFVNITNIGEGNATNYKINLYCEQHVENVMNYEGLKSTTTIDINVSEIKNVSLIWNFVDYGEAIYNGEWIVGVILVWDDGHPDSDSSNNWDHNRSVRLKVNEIEKPEQNNPIINLIKPRILQEFEQNLPVEIIARVTDESGIESVNITITAPDKKTYDGVMIKQENDKYGYTFETTNLLNKYNFTITAVDDSIYNLVSTKTSNFTIVEDATPPEIEYIGVLPSVQLKDADVTISSIVSDRSGVKFVQVTITYPDGSSETHDMTNSSNDNKYYFTQSYEMLGRYVFYITTEDVFENKKTATNEEVEFWITIDLEDTDSDGMPDWWEEKYGFDPFDPNDADEDEDDDGYTNVEEYEERTNPLKPLSLLERIVSKSKENWIYVLVSGILFIVLIGLSMYGFFRRKK